jgi:hypothetical protein
MNHTGSTQSFDILDNNQTPKDDKKDNFGSFDEIPSNNNMNDMYNEDDDLPILDDEIGNEEEKKNVEKEEIKSGYEYKRMEIENIISKIMADCPGAKEKKDIKCLENHLEKLNDAENKKVNFEEFNKKMVTAAKCDKKMNSILKKVYKN